MPQDFSNQNLRGKSFKWQDLTGANFSGADLRGVNFEGAKLVGADFRQVRTGMTDLMATIHKVSLFLVSGFFSFVAFFIEIMFVLYFPTVCGCEESLLEILNLSNLQQIGIEIFRLIMFFGISYLTLIRGISSGLVLVIGTVVVIVAGVEAMILTEVVTGAVVETVATGAMVMAAVITWIGMVAMAMAVVVAVAVATGAVIGTVVGAGVLVIIPVVLIAVETHADFSDIIFLLSKIGIGYLCYICCIGYLTWCIRREDDRFTAIRQLGIALNAYFSTNFRNANLSEAILKHARFLNATTIRTCWQQAKKLETANLKNTMLEKRAIRQLLVIGDGQDQSFAGCNLAGAYLANTNLQNVDFTETILFGADLHGANLTGACLENWLIGSTTRLEGAHADYVYLLRNQQERRPASA